MSVTPTLIQGYDMEYLVSKEDLEVYYDPRLDVLWVGYDEHLKEIEYLQAQLDATQSLLDKAMTLIPDPEDTTRLNRGLRCGLAGVRDTLTAHIMTSPDPHLSDALASVKRMLARVTIPAPSE